MRLAAVAAAIALAVTACAASDGGARLPPHQYPEIAELLDPVVAPLGYRISRASLIETDTYQAVPDGTHLAVYLEPLHPMSPDEYALATATTAALLVPMVFDRWPELRSFDVCQEPYGWSGDGVPPSQTIVDVTRRGSHAWKGDGLQSLIAVASITDELAVWVAPEVRGSEAWTAAGGS